MHTLEKTPELRDFSGLGGQQKPRKQSTKSGVEGGARDIAGEDLSIEHPDIESLIPYARNARTHSDKQIAEIAASIREFGWTNPVLIDGENGIIAGHGRVLAARKLALPSVPVIELAGLSEAQKRAYLLADNRLALNAGWDEEMLAAEVADLVALGVDLDVTGFGAGEVDKLLDLHQQGLAGTSRTKHPSPLPCRSAARAIFGCSVTIVCSAEMPLWRKPSRRAWAARWPTWSSPIHPTTWTTRERPRSA
ncbi:MAG: hypothetical protein QOJ51_2412 [Acidobacteriaceae bacterium]|jgi:hypothetical protein|nr:hypothetical protein [Acidobacteriaceae bacterium]MEA3140407.1 hypothetical protein [Gammaproteobacteria bacterium]